MAMQGLQGLVKALLAHVEKKHHRGQTATFAFGEAYGSLLKYDNQPSVSGILEKSEFLYDCVLDLKSHDRKSSTVADAFLQSKEQFKHGNINISSYVDKLLAN